MSFVDKLTENSSVTLTSQAAVTLSKEVALTKFNHVFPTEVIWVGYWPVSITPVLLPVVGLQGSVSENNTVGVNQSASVSAGIQYSSGTVSPVADFNSSFGFQPPTNPSVGFSANVHAGPEVELLIYSAAGPKLNVFGFLELDAVPFQAPWWQLFGGLEAGVGFTLKILDHTLVDVGIPDLISYKKLLAQASTSAPPAVTTLAATSIASTSAVLNGSINSNGTGGCASFEYGTDPNLTNPFGVGTSFTVAANSTTQSFSTTVTLSPNTTYYYAMLFSPSPSCIGLQVANIVSLKTLPFVVTTLAATSITSTSAVLNGTINSNGTGGCASFEYGTDPNLTNPFGVGTSFTVAANSTTQSFSTTVTLSPNTTYYYAMLFSPSPSCIGLQVANIVSLKTLPFVVTTLAATSITSTSAVLNGSVNPNGTAGCAGFEYGTDPNLTNAFGAGSFTVAANSTAQSFSTTVTLSPNTTYYYAMLFSPGCSGLQAGNIVSFKTLSFVVTTLAATSITSTSAVLNGNVNPNGTAGCAGFEYGTDPNLTNAFGAGSFTVAANSTAQSFSTTVTLSPNTTYYYAMLFSPGCSGLQAGNIVSFKTLP